MTLSKTILRAGIALFLFAATAPLMRAETGCAGTIDPSFAPPAFGAPFNFTYTPLLAPAEKGVVAALGAVVTRLDETGAVDPSFVFSARRANSDGFIKGVERDSNGRYLIWGYFDQVESTPRPGIARLLSNGKIDLTFAPPIRHWTIDAAAILPDGGVIIAAETNVVIRPIGSPSPAIFIRLNADGSVDPQFNADAGADDLVAAVQAQPDGKILVGGRFKNFDGHATKGLVRLLPNGVFDETFNPQKQVPEVTGVKALADGKFLSYWSGGIVFSDPVDPQATNSLVRYNNDGSFDTTFKPVRGSVGDVEIQSDGKYVIPGLAAVRLLPNGDVDPTFNSDFTVAPGGGGPLFLSGDGSVAFGPNEEIYVTGGFWEINGLYRPHLVRLLNDQQTCVSLIGFESAYQIVNEADGAASLAILRTGSLTDRLPFDVSYFDVLVNSNRTTNLIFEAGSGRLILQIPLRDDHVLNANTNIGAYIQTLPADAAFGPIRSSSIMVVDASSGNGPGSVDPSFNVDSNGSITDIAVRPDGKILISGDFYPQHIVRLNADFSLDSTFNYSAEFPRRMANWGDKLYVLGIYGDPPNSLRRLTADGSNDDTFAPPVFLSPYAVTLRISSCNPMARSLSSARSRTSTALIESISRGSTQTDQSMPPLMAATCSATSTGWSSSRC